MEITNTLKISVLIYLGACMLLYEMKPPVMFLPDGTMKKFGLRENESVFPYWLVTTIIGITSYYLQICYEGKYVT